MDTSDAIAAVSALFSLGALTVAWRALRQAARGELSAESVRRSAGSDRFSVGVTNVGGAAARHVVVTLLDDTGRAVCEPSPQRTLHGGDAHTFELVESGVEPVYPLRVRFEWRRWKRRWIENHQRLAWLWRLRATSTTPFTKSNVEAQGAGAIGVVAAMSTGTSGPTYLRVSRASPAAVAQHLRPLDASCSPQSPPWNDLVRVGRGSGRLGEVKKTDDWADVPRDESLRVAVIASGGEPVLRWVADQHWVKDHDAFYRVQDPERPRTGNVKIFSGDEPMLVQS